MINNKGNGTAGSPDSRQDSNQKKGNQHIPDGPDSCLLYTSCLISFLTGTAFGSAATIGVICMTMANSAGVPPVYTGGAILAGVFFGDRCSPVSTSALLVSELTGTSLYSNLAAMGKTALIPFLISCGLYWYLGLGSGDAASGMSSQQIFAEYYRLSFWTVLPVAAVLLLSLLRVKMCIRDSDCSGQWICAWRRQ